MKARERQHAVRSRAGSRSTARHRGAVLLEVLLAVALFVTAAAIVTVGLNSSLRSLERQRLQTRAVHLAASVLAEIQLGIRSSALGGAPQPLEPPFADWTWEIATQSGQTDFSATEPLETLEVVLRHKDGSVVQRLALRMPPRITGPTNAVTAPVSGGTPP